jgi:hypothetical protein
MLSHVVTDRKHWALLLCHLHGFESVYRLFIQFRAIKIPWNHSF